MSSQLVTPDQVQYVRQGKELFNFGVVGESFLEFVVAISFISFALMDEVDFYWIYEGVKGLIPAVSHTHDEKGQVHVHHRQRSYIEKMALQIVAMLCCSFFIFSGMPIFLTTGRYCMRHSRGWFHLILGIFAAFLLLGSLKSRNGTIALTDVIETFVLFALIWSGYVLSGIHDRLGKDKPLGSHLHFSKRTTQPNDGDLKSLYDYLDEPPTLSRMSESSRDIVLFPPSQFRRYSMGLFWVLCAVTFMVIGADFYGAVSKLIILLTSILTLEHLDNIGSLSYLKLSATKRS